jgi:hypothetical protein
MIHVRHREPVAAAKRKTRHDGTNTQQTATPDSLALLAEHLVLRRSGGLSGVPRTRSHLELGR